MGTRSILFPAVVGLLLTGCTHTKHLQPAPIVAVAPAGPATTTEIAALKDQVADQQELARAAAAAVYGAQDANESNPEGLAKDAVTAQLQEAASALPEPTAEQKLAKEAQNARILAGQLAEVKAEMGVAIDENQRLRGEVEKARAEAAAIAAAGAAERAAAAAKLQAQFDDLTTRIQKANAAAKAAADEARNQVLRDQVKWLNRAGAACAGIAVLAFGLGAMFGGVASLRIVAPFAAILGFAALVAFGLAQVVGAPWFKFAVLGVAAIAGAGIAWWTWSHYRKGTLAQDAERKLAKAKDALGTIVPVLDRAYNDAEDSVKAALDTLVFQKLPGKRSSYDATIHEVRAERAVQQPQE